ncbi:MAG TPA: ComEA family DNA-binding protein [Candidatus Limnocylindrales bacterium]|nr:ComEA family DNA-binding protein [Candidatus Limnocylindrales bacterium]
MDPTAPPWRALEDPTERRTGDAAGPMRSSGLPRSALAIAGAAVLLALLAFLLAFGTSAGGTVVVDGGAPLGSVVGEGSVGPVDAVSVGAELVVEVVGAIEQPGVYRLAQGSRVGDLVDAAGGYGARVDTSRASHELNLAAPLHDGDQIRVPSRDDATDGRSGTAAGAGPGTGSGETGPLDLNRATSAELEALPGIGPVTAGKILSSREEQPFAAVEDLRTRKLLGEKTFEKLKDLVTVR